MRTFFVVLLVTIIPLGCKQRLDLCRVASRIEQARDPVVKDIETAVQYLAKTGDMEKAREMVDVAPGIMSGFQNVKFSLVNINNGIADMTLGGTLLTLRELLGELNELYTLIKGTPLLENHGDVDRLLMLAELLAGDTTIPAKGKKCAGSFTRTDYEAWGKRLESLLVVQ